MAGWWMARVPVWGHRLVLGCGKGAHQVTWACTGVSTHLVPRRHTQGTSKNGGFFTILDQKLTENQPFHPGLEMVKLANFSKNRHFPTDFTMYFLHFSQKYLVILTCFRTFLVQKSIDFAPENTCVFHPFLDPPRGR